MGFNISTIDVTLADVRCVFRELNPGIHIGSVQCYHYIKNAIREVSNVVSLKLCAHSGS